MKEEKAHRGRGLRGSGLGLTRSWHDTLPAGGRDALQQLTVLFTAYVAYDLIRIVSRGREVVAIAHSQAVIDAQKALHIYWEPWLQQEALRSQAVVEFLNWFYSSVHLPAILLTLAWVYLCRHEVWLLFRNAFLAMNAIGLTIFALVPVAPPRLVPTSGMIDTKYLYADQGFNTGVMAFVTNPYAAMPSLHMGYALFTAVALWVLCRGLAMRVLAVVYSVVVLASIVLTGNHYFLDAVAGAGVLALAFAVSFASAAGRAPLPAAVASHDGDAA